MSSAIVAVIIGVAMAVLGLPLAATIALVTFITAYVPYLGAIFSGAFAFLIALGSGGAEEAFLVLVVVLVAQNVVQTAVLTKLTSDRLRIHPMVSFASTIVGRLPGRHRRCDPVRPGRGHRHAIGRAPAGPPREP